MIGNGRISRGVFLQGPRGIVFLVLSVVLAVGLGWPAVGLYHRLGPARGSLGPTRERILRIVYDLPGITPSQVARSVGISSKTVLYHARVLHSLGALRVERGWGGRIHLFAPGLRPRFPLPSPELVRTLEVVRRNPGSSQSEISRILNLPRPTVRGWLHKLEEAGFVRSRPQGTWRVYDPAEGYASAPADSPLGSSARTG